MPELPEVETVARTLRPHVQHCRIMDVRVLRPGSLHELSLPPQSLTGLRISDVTRRGKLLLLPLAADAESLALAGSEALLPAARPTVLAVHLRMTGRLMTYPPGTMPGPHTRCIFDLEHDSAGSCRLFFNDVRAFGLVLAATPRILAQWDFWCNLGPEPLDLDATALAVRLGVKPASEGGKTGKGNNGCKTGPALKAALLDQRVLAGIGNIYADEALFDAGLDPRRKCGTLDTAACARLAASLQKVLRLSIAQCGSSIRDYCDADGNVGAFQNFFAVYGRGALPCVRCGRPLQKIRVAGRATVMCPHCQQ